MTRKKFVITPAEIKKIESLAAKGMNEEDIAWYLGITPSTLSRKKKEYEQIEQAIKLGKARGKGFVVGKLFAKIKEGNLSAIIFYLKTQCKWSEHVTVNEGDKTSFLSLTPEQQIIFIKNLSVQIRSKLLADAIKELKAERKG